MALEPTTKPADAEVAAYAAALIERERSDARAGLWALMAFFGLGTIGSVAIALLVAQSHRNLAIPAVVVVALIVLTLVRRFVRFTRALNKLQQSWRSGRMSDGQLALDIARQHVNQ